jgi:hypothetical protein
VARADACSWQSTQLQIPSGSGSRRRLRDAYDNEAGKGDHRHTLGGTEEPYVFTDPETLVNDFLADVEAWRTAQWEP